MSVPEMIRTKSFARNIIARFGTRDDIFDEQSLAFLREFCEAPSESKALLSSRDMLDKPGQSLGTRANKVHGSLVGYLISKHGSDEAILRDEEITELADWFNSGSAGI